MKIKTKMERLLKKQADVVEQINKVQQECPHEDVTGTYGASIGNWYVGDNDYWINAKCEDCGKTFVVNEYKNREEYRRLSLSGKIKREGEGK